MISALVLVIVVLIPSALDIWREGGHAPRSAGGSLMIALIGLAYAYFASGRYIHFVPDGFEVKERFRSARHMLWSDVDAIGIASFPSSARGRLSYQNFAGIKLGESAKEVAFQKCRTNRAACGYDILLDANYGMALDRFIVLLKEKKREAENG